MRFVIELCDDPIPEKGTHLYLACGPQPQDRFYLVSATDSFEARLMVGLAGYVVEAADADEAYRKAISRLDAASAEAL